jgi:hypothetical protein
MPPEEKAHFAPQGVLSIFVAPIFVRDEFWGFVSYDNFHVEQLFNESEQSILLSGSMLMVNSFLSY